MDKKISFAVLKKYLTLITFFFLAVPFLIYFFGWLHWWLAVPMTVICLLPLLWEWKRSNDISVPAHEQEPAAISGWQIVIVCGMTLVLVLISGIGGWGFQNVDWEKHNMMLRDLVEQPWPVMYQYDGMQLPLVYYFAYYLPAALIGKAFGWIAANYALLVESWLGLSLVTLWGVTLIKRSWWKAALFVIFFAGMDVLGFALMAPAVQAFAGETLSIYDFEWWSIGWNYPSFNWVLFWTPNQGFVGWLVMAIILDELFNQERKYTLWYLGLTTFWSPFITVGLIPFVLADWVSEPRTLPVWIRKYGLPNLCGVLLGGLIGFMYLSKFHPLPPEISGEIVSVFFFSLTKNAFEVVLALILLILFWLFETGLYGILTWKLLDKNDRRSRLILATVLIVLAALPFYQYGFYNDLLQKASIPSIFALAIIIGRVVLSKGTMLGKKLALTVLLVIGFMTAFVNIGIQVEGIIKNGALWHLPSSGEVSTLWQLQKKEEENAFNIEGLENIEYNSFVSQYIGSNEAAYFRWFVRK
ncbi:MAG: hypothetical protein HY869_05040 [Chloroflexi bacterium]|nr:hypothetical protein [Chloroflexota bacterium]